MLKKSMDIIDIYAWVQTSSKGLLECYVDNAYRYKHAWILKLRCRDEGIKLLKIEPGQRVHISKTEPSEKEVDRFSQYLRAHLRGWRVASISMPWWERVVLVEFSRSGAVQRHYVELVPRGVWVVAGSDSRILYASRFEEFKDRAVKTGLHYTPPPPRGIPPGDINHLVEALLQGRDLVRSVVSNWGLPGYIAEELLLRAGLYEAKLKKPTEIPRGDVTRLAEEYGRLVEESRGGRGYLVYGAQGLETFTPYRPQLFTEVYDWEVRELASFEEALDSYFAEFEAVEEARERSEKLKAELESWKRRVEEQERLVEEYKSRLEEVNRTLSLIYENYSWLEGVVECARQARLEKGWSSVLECGVKGFKEDRGIVIVDVSGVPIEFSIREEFAKQVLELEKKRGELEKKFRRALEVLEELKSKSLELEKELSERFYAKPAPKFWYERYRWSITRNGFLVVAGRDAHQNEAVVKKYLQDGNLFLHADIHGAPATVLITRSAKPEPGDIEDAAVIAACYSRAWRAGFSYVEVYWVYGYQVSKTPPPGEYLGKGAFMVYGERNYLRIPLKLGIGLRLFCDIVYGDYVKLYVGNPELVREKSISYVVLVPGEVDQQEVARVVAKLLVEHAYRRTGVRFEIAPQQLVEVLPGPSRVVEHGVGVGETVCKEG